MIIYLTQIKKIFRGFPKVIHSRKNLISLCPATNYKLLYKTIISNLTVHNNSLA